MTKSQKWDLAKETSTEYHRDITAVGPALAAVPSINADQGINPRLQTKLLETANSEDLGFVCEPSMFGDSTYFKLLSADSTSFTEFLRNDVGLNRLIDGKNAIYLNRYFQNIIVDEQLALLFDIAKISGYDPDNVLFDQFVEGAVGKHEADIIRYQIQEQIAPADYYFPDRSRTYIPRVAGAPNNPYYRYRLAQSKACHEMAKLDDLPTANTIISLVFTYPQEVSYLAFKIGIAALENRCNDCFKDFWNRLHSMETIINGKKGTWLPEKTKGASSSTLHPWATNNPLKPHFHHHVVMPNICVYWDYAGNNIHSRNVKDMRAEIDEYLKEDREAIMELLARNISSTPNKIVVNTKIHEPNLFTRTLKLFVNDYKEKLAQQLEMTQLKWVNVDDKKLPFPADAAKKLWFRTVCDHFKDVINESDYDQEIFNLHADYVYCKNERYRTRTLHWLAYKARDPIQDINKFLKMAPNLISMDLDPTAKHLPIVLNKNAIKDTEAIKTLSSLDDNKIIEWLLELVRYKTKTKVYGFWKYLKSFSCGLSYAAEDYLYNPVTGRMMTWICCSVKEISVPYVVEEINSSRFLIYSKPG